MYGWMPKCCKSHLNLKPNLKKLAIDSNFAKNPNALGGFIAKQNIMINAIYSIQ
jgi:hypothetical protein